MLASSIPFRGGFQVDGAYQAKRPKWVLRSGASKKRPRRAKISFLASRSSALDSRVNSPDVSRRLSESGKMKSLASTPPFSTRSRKSTLVASIVLNEGFHVLGTYQRNLLKYAVSSGDVKYRPRRAKISLR